METAILLYDRVTALAAIGPQAVFPVAPDAQVKFAARNAGLIATEFGMPGLNAGFTRDAVPDILAVAGAPNPAAAMADNAVPGGA